MKDKLCMKISWLLPRRLVYWCCVRVSSHATVGQYSNTVVPELTIMEALKRWE